MNTYVIIILSQVMAFALGMTLMRLRDRNEILDLQAFLEVVTNRALDLDDKLVTVDAHHDPLREAPAGCGYVDFITKLDEFHERRMTSPEVYENHLGEWKAFPILTHTIENTTIALESYGTYSHESVHEAFVVTVTRNGKLTSRENTKDAEYAYKRFLSMVVLRECSSTLIDMSGHRRSIA